MFEKMPQAENLFAPLMMHYEYQHAMHGNIPRGLLNRYFPPSSPHPYLSTPMAVRVKTDTYTVTGWMRYTR